MFAGSRNAATGAAMTIYTPDADRTQGVSLAPCPICDTPAPLGAVFCPECGFLLGSTPGPEPVASAVSLRGGDGTIYRLHVGENSVGRQNADINLAHPSVSRRHAVVRLDESGAVTIEDQGSTNGTRISGRPVQPGQPARAMDLDTVRFGHVDLSVQGATSSLALPSAGETKPVAALPAPPGKEPRQAPALVSASGARFALTAMTTTVGRRSDNDIVLTGDPFVSGAHARIVFDGSAYQVMDLGSTNGTSLNGRRLAPNAPSVLADSDEIVFGKTSLSFRLR